MVLRKADSMRQRFLSLALLFSLFAIFWTQTVAQSGHWRATNYPARTDHNIQQNTEPTPDVGGLTGAGTCVVPSDFNLPVCRLSDANLDPSLENQTHVTTATGSGDLNLWNTRSTLFVMQGGGGRSYPMTFNPDTLQASRLYPTSYPTTGGFYFVGNSPSWSYTNPTLLFFAEGSTIKSYDFSGHDTDGSPPSAVEVYDFAAGSTGSWGVTGDTCLPANYAATWNSFGEISKNPADQMFLSAFSNNGKQNTGSDVVAYKVGNGCTHLDTATGMVTGDWGNSGVVGIPDRFMVHNVKISKDGKWAIVAHSRCITRCTSLGPYMWKIGTTYLYPSCLVPNKCGGHWTEGFSHFINDDNSPTYQQVKRVFGSDSPGSTILQLPLPAIECKKGFSGMDQHQNWSNVDSTDTYPFFLTTTNAPNPSLQPDGGFTCAWVNEVLAVSPLTGTVYRFAHTRNTGLSWNFSTKNAIGGVSQDGRFFVFSSDWGGTLGSEDGGATCTPSKDCRGDVFVVALTAPCPAGQLREASIPSFEDCYSPLRRTEH
jgi:hypothetical protein